MVGGALTLMHMCDQCSPLSVSSIGKGERSPVVCLARQPRPPQRWLQMRMEDMSLSGLDNSKLEVRTRVIALRRHFPIIHWQNHQTVTYGK